MLKLIAVGLAALFVTASPLAYAQAPSGGAARAVDVSTLTDAQITIVKAALQLTPDQDKHWPAVESAIRTRAKDRQARIATAAERSSELRDRSPIEALRDRDPVDFLHRRADALAQRAADLKRLADAWQPLYQTLNPDQKRRMALLTIFVLREMRNGVEQRRLQAEEEDEG
jgi:hypothetical protein